MSGFGRKFTAAAIAMSLCAVPTAAVATTPAAPIASTQAAAVPASPWLTLSALTTGSSAATSAAVAAAAEDNDNGPGWPPIAPLVVILATIAAMVYILVKDNGHGGFHLTPVSPS